MIFRNLLAKQPKNRKSAIFGRKERINKSFLGYFGAIIGK